MVTCHPLADEGELTVLPGINEDEVADQRIISSGTCTAHGLGPVLDVLDERFGVESGFFTTVHASTSDQPSVDSWHTRSLRKGRAVANNIVPVETVAHLALAEAMPSMRGKLSGYSLRVPILLGSLLELDVQVRRTPSLKELETVFRKAAEDKFSGIITVRDDQPVSSDLIASPYSAIIDSHLLDVRDNGLVRVCFWYDNETGFCHRLEQMLFGCLAPV
ncbi:MAG: hypothetical protein U5N86_06205 [Planctomycetota bacterium]|nr:hypothetical protein [Planctomycetota bacterium]